MELTEHLGELRSRLIRIVAILAVSFFVCYALGDEIAQVLLRPLREALLELRGDSGHISAFGVLDKVLAQFQLALWSGVILSSPLWFYQVWLFIRPALYDVELKIVRPFVFVGFLLFAAGVAFGYFIVFPYSFITLMQMGPSGVGELIDVRAHLVLSTKILVFLGLIFQLPNLMLILGFLEILSSEKLSEWRRYIYVFFAFIAAVLTPPDLFTMGALWLPLVALFELGALGIRLIVNPYHRRKNAA